MHSDWVWCRHNTAMARLIPQTDPAGDGGYMTQRKHTLHNCEGGYSYVDCGSLEEFLEPWAHRMSLTASCNTLDERVSGTRNDGLSGTEVAKGSPTDAKVERIVSNRVAVIKGLQRPYHTRARNRLTKRQRGASGAPRA